MAVKLDVLINYIFDNTKLKRNISSINNMMTKGTLSPRGAGGASFDALRAMLGQGKEGVRFFENWKQHQRDVLKNTMASINKLNVGGFFKDYIDPEKNKSGRRINLNKEEVKSLSEKVAEKQLKAEVKMMEDEARAEEVAWKENRRFDKQKQTQERRNQEAEAKDIQQRRKLDIKRNLQHSRALEENKKRDEDLRKKQWMLMLGKWGKFGVWGIAAQQAIKYISKAIGFVYSTSMQGLDWQRTISGGASGGSWFGQGLASYQRAGIGANQYQGFKRGIQGYLGQVKLGMGNAAPLMYLGLSALGNPDELEKQLEQSLRRLPKDVSLALAGQMGLDYNMWEAIYSGRLDREKSAYSEDAIQKWAAVADKLNDLLTTFKVWTFEKTAGFAYNLTHFGDALKNSGFLDKLSFLYAGATPMNLANALIRFGKIEVVVKNEKGEVLGRGETQPDYSGDIIELGSGVK